MTDSDFAVGIDELLWVTPSGEARDNTENFRAVGWSLEDLEKATDILHNLVDALVTLSSWREHPQIAVPLLEALLFTETQTGQRDIPEL